jgi:hypothetical protein
MGRPGLIGKVARTAVVAGAGAAVAGRVRRGSEPDGAEQEPSADDQQQATTDEPDDQAAPQVQSPQATREAELDGRMARLRELGEMKKQGLLTEEEFARPPNPLRHAPHRAPTPPRRRRPCAASQAALRR